MVSKGNSLAILTERVLIYVYRARAWGQAEKWNQYSSKKWQQSFEKQRWKKWKIKTGKNFSHFFWKNICTADLSQASDWPSCNNLRLHAYIIGHYNPSVKIIYLAPHTAYVVCVNFIHFIFLARNLLRENRRRNICCILFWFRPGSWTLALRLISQHLHTRLRWL